MSTSTLEPARTASKRRKRELGDGPELHTHKAIGVHKKKLNPGRIIAWAVLILFMVVTLFPFYWMVRTAFSTTTSLAAEASNLLPADFTLGAIKRVLGLQSFEESLAQGGSGASMDFLLFMRNSLIVSTVVTICQVACCSMAAYAFSRLRWPGRDAVFFAFLTALMIPPVFTMLPNFVLMKDLGLINTFLGIMLPTMFMTPFAVFFMRQFFLGIPREIEESAAIDGAGHWKRFTRIVLPMSSAPLITLALLTFITTWNDYMWPLLIARQPAVETLTVALGIFKGQTPQSGPDWAGLMAAALFAALPVILLYLLLGKRLINSIGFSGIK
ncbi:MAG: carbohydrate ABC transporter permease [Propionibacteriaceae bacterium]|jgi:multiple sugar transport system permease protein|nr:carbohydrate ABC transporter permease [Propionibacteriaceae bacterium]